MLQVFPEAASSQPTYEELKHTKQYSIFSIPYRSQPTYEELKLNTMLKKEPRERVLSLPMRN